MYTLHTRVHTELNWTHCVCANREATKPEMLHIQSKKENDMNFSRLSQLSFDIVCVSVCLCVCVSMWESTEIRTQKFRENRYPLYNRHRPFTAHTHTHTHTHNWCTVQTESITTITITTAKRTKTRTQVLPLPGLSSTSTVPRERITTITTITNTPTTQ